MKKPWIFTLTVFLLMAMASAATAQDTTNAIRKWQSRDGQHALQASFVRYDQNSREVFLKSESGKQFSVNIDDLSTQDKSYVAGFRERPELPKPKKPVSVEPKPEIAEKPVEENKINDGDINVSKRFGVHWVSDLDQAAKLASANDGNQDDRPIMMFRVLGDLNGFM